MLMFLDLREDPGFFAGFVKSPQGFVKRLLLSHSDARHTIANPLSQIEYYAPIHFLNDDMVNIL
jgi:hypothetical protein